MFKRLGHVLLIAAVLAATGTHWMLLQSVAWTTMLAENLQTSSFGQAVQRTFDGKHLCVLCKEIAKGKQQEQKSELRTEWKKLDFSYSPAVFVFSAPTFYWEFSALTDPSPLHTHAPPLPPPKSLLG